MHYFASSDFSVEYSLFPSLAITPPPSAPPLKIRGGRGSYDAKGEKKNNFAPGSETRFIEMSKHIPVPDLCFSLRALRLCA